MNAYVCVYRRHIPGKADFERTRAAAGHDPYVRKFLDEYYRPDRYLDWGDDPSFFAAKEFLGNVNRASWGVCRPNVRAKLKPGDFVAFFCAKPALAGPRWDYYFIGVGTVGDVVSRQAIWSRPALRPYRSFYNILAAPSERNVLAQHETFFPYHPNWRDRLPAYVLFDPNPGLTSFNLRNPLWAATYTGRIPEVWRTRSSALVKRLGLILFTDRGVSRRLRTSRTGFSHPPLNLSRPMHPAGLPSLRTELLAITKEAARGGERSSPPRHSAMLPSALPRRGGSGCAGRRRG